MDERRTVSKPVRVIRLSGELSRGRAPELERVLDQALTAGAYRLALDMSGVVGLSDTSLSVLLRALKRARDGGGDIRLFSARAGVALFVAAFGLDDILTFYANEEDVVASFQV